MISILPILFALCTGTWSEPLSEALKRRSDVFGVYASDFAQEYEPISFAAVPLHPPVPIIQILSPAPTTSRLHEPHHYASSSQALTYAQPYLYAPAISHTAHMEPYSKLQPTFGKLESAYSKLEPVYNKLEPSYNKLEPSASMLYARPNKYGGYTYIRRPTRRQPQKRPPRKHKPVILRVHKYRIIRSR